MNKTSKETVDFLCHKTNGIMNNYCKKCIQLSFLVFMQNNSNLEISSPHPEGGEKKKYMITI